MLIDEEVEHLDADEGPKIPDIGEIEVQLE